MIDYYLKFADEAEANAVLYADEQLNYRNIDVLGVLYEKQEIVDPENPPEPVPLDGWHVNVRVVDGEDGSKLESFKVNPEPLTWRRVWG